MQACERAGECTRQGAQRLAGSVSHWQYVPMAGVHWGGPQDPHPSGSCPE